MNSKFGHTFLRSRRDSQKGVVEPQPFESVRTAEFYNLSRQFTARSHPAHQRVLYDFPLALTEHFDSKIATRMLDVQRVVGRVDWAVADIEEEMPRRLPQEMPFSWVP